MRGESLSPLIADAHHSKPDLVSAPAVKSSWSGATVRGACSTSFMPPPRGMRIPSIVSDPHNNPATACMDSVGDESPTGNLMHRVDTGRTWVTMSIGSDRRSFRDDQPR